MVLAPPSLEPEGQTIMRWLRPPWESPPTRPSPALCKFLKEMLPSLLEDNSLSSPPVLTWAEVYPSITKYPSVLRALLAPVTRPEEYYKALVATARKAGLKDRQVILGLLWHAPVGDSAQISQRWEYFQRLVRDSEDEEQAKYLPERRSPRNRGVTSPQDKVDDSKPPGTESSTNGINKGKRLQETSFPCSSPSAPESASGNQLCWDETCGTNGNGRTPQIEAEEYCDSWSELFHLSRDHLEVSLRRYEALIYELGKLGAWQEFFQGQQGENRNLRAKIESEWAKELEFFRQQNSKNDKKG